MIAHTLNMCAPYILCTFDNIFGIIELRHYYVYTTFGVLTSFICVQSAIQTDSFPFIQTLHNDCSPIEDVHRRRRSRAEFDLVNKVLWSWDVNINAYVCFYGEATFG